VLPLTVKSITLSKNSATGGTTITGNTVTLNGTAPPGGAVVSLSTSDSSVSVPGTVTVATGQAVCPAFSITTSSVSITKTVTISATYNGVTTNLTLTVTP
jgi:hypothetical protein